MARKKRKSKPLLSRQKVRKRRKVSPGWDWRKKLSVSLLVFLAIGLPATLWMMEQPSSRPKRKMAIADAENAKPQRVIFWQIDIQQRNGALSDKALNAIKAMSRENNFGTEEDLQRLARRIQAAHQLESVTVYRSGPEALTLQLVHRIPIAVMKKQPLHLLSHSGSIYPSSQATPGLPDVFGFESIDWINLDDVGYVRLKIDERRNVQELLQLIQQLQAMNLEFRAIRLEMYRGFEVQLPQSVAMVGHAPFENALTRLKSLLENHKKKGIRAARIELDFKGKAFVKEAL